MRLRAKRKAGAKQAKEKNDKGAAVNTSRNRKGGPEARHAFGESQAAARHRQYNAMSEKTSKRKEIRHEA